MSTSRIRQNYHPECEAAINKQINCELYASYVYQSMVIFDSVEQITKVLSNFGLHSHEEVYRDLTRQVIQFSSIYLHQTTWIHITIKENTRK